MIARGNLVKKIIGLNVFQTSVFIFYITIGKITGGTAPIYTPEDWDARTSHGHGHGHGQGAGLDAHATVDHVANDHGTSDHAVSDHEASISGAHENSLHASSDHANQLNATHGGHAASPDGAVIDGHAISAHANEPLVAVPSTIHIGPGGEALSTHGGGTTSAIEVVYSNPLPHVLILTAIVVGVATTAVGLALAMRIREAYGTIEEDELEALDNVAEFGAANPSDGIAV